MCIILGVLTLVYTILYRPLKYYMSIIFFNICEAIDKFYAQKNPLIFTQQNSGFVSLRSILNENVLFHPLLR